MLKIYPSLGCLAFLLAFSVKGRAQEASSTRIDTTKPTANIGYEGKFALGLQAGLPGYGGELAYNFHDHFNLRVGATFLQLSGIEVPYDVDGREINVGLESDGAVYDIKLEYLPSKTKAFKLIAGLAYISNYGGKATIKLTEGVFIGDLEIGPDDVGQLDMDVVSEGVAPYLGFGFGRAVPKRRVGFGVEFGTYYVGAPTVTMEATELLTPSANREQEENFEEGLSSFRWLPNVNAKLTIKLN